MPGGPGTPSPSSLIAIFRRQQAEPSPHRLNHSSSEGKRQSDQWIPHPGEWGWGGGHGDFPGPREEEGDFSGFSTKNNGLKAGDFPWPWPPAPLRGSGWDHPALVRGRQIKAIQCDVGVPSQELPMALFMNLVCWVAPGVHQTPPPRSQHSKGARTFVIHICFV